MTLSVSEQCRSCLINLQEIISILSQPDRNDGHIKDTQVVEELERFSLFVGNIGALHRPESSMSIESRLHEANGVLTHVSGLLGDLDEVVAELLDIVSGKREGMVSVTDKAEKEHDGEISEVGELREEISGTITQLFRMSILIRQAAPTDLFAKALSRNRYRFNDQFDIAHVGEKYPKLATDDYSWLRQRLGRAITQRRHYLNYMQDHRERLEGILHEKADNSAVNSQALVIKQPLDSKPTLGPASRPSLFTKATTVTPEQITPQMLVAEDSNPEEDALSYTTISHSVDSDHELFTTIRIPKLDDLRIGNKREIECPFCFRIKRFKSERTWRKHVFSDLRSYVCTFPDCDAPYFGDINKWFQHEMTFHRVVYKCFLCLNRVFYRKEEYLSHLRRKHTDVLDNNEQQLGIDLARKPLAQILANDCPCCSDWADSLRERTTHTRESVPNDILAVVPTVFKRHLANHLEQLALFAVPIGAATDDDNNSDPAIEERSKHTNASQLSTLTFVSSRGDSTLNVGWRASTGRKRVLTVEQRSYAAWMRVAGTCSNCERREVRCDPGIPCKSCIEHYREDLVNHPCRDSTLSDLYATFLSNRLRSHPSFQSLESFVLADGLEISTGITYTIPLNIGFGPALDVSVHAVQLKDDHPLIHEHIIYSWPPMPLTSPPSRHRNVVIPAVLTADAHSSLAQTLDSHLSLLVTRNFRAFPLYCSQLQILREIYIFFCSLPASSHQYRTLHQALKLLVLVHTGDNITSPLPSQSRALDHLMHSTKAISGDLAPTPCFIRSQFSAIIPQLALTLIKDVVMSLTQFLLSRQHSEWPIALAVLITVLMTVESIHYHAAKLPYHDHYDTTRSSSTEKDLELEDHSVKALLDFYSACFSGCHARLRPDWEGEPMQSHHNTAEDVFIQGLRNAIKKASVSGYLVEKAKEKRPEDDMRYFFDRLVARLLILRL